MTQLLPYEPMFWSWEPPALYIGGTFDAEAWQAFEDEASVKALFASGSTLRVWLANDQKIVVRALSEDRKAARAEARWARLRGVE